MLDRNALASRFSAARRAKSIARFVPHIVAGARFSGRIRAAVIAAVAGALLLPAGAAAVPAPTTGPSLGGTATEGQQLTLTPGTGWSAGTATINGVTDTWCTASSAPPSPPTACATPLSVAPNPPSSSPYTLKSTDVSKYIYVVETATASDNSTTTVYSNVEGPVAAGVPQNTVAPTITGTAQQGQTLTVNPGTWSFAPTFTYQWYRCNPTCAVIGGPTASASYVLTSADVNFQIQVHVTATNKTASAAPLIASDPTTVTPLAPASCAPGPNITGTLQSGQTLTEHGGCWTNTPTSIAIQWYRCNSSGGACVLVTSSNTGAYTAPGAALGSYPLTAADVGGTLYVTETAANAGGMYTAFTSLTTPIQPGTPGPPPPPGVTSPPFLGGGTQQGQTLLGNEGSWSNNPTLTAQWLRCHGSSCTAIPGATSAAYTLTGDDVGSTIKFRVNASNNGGNATADSGPTTTITTTSTISLQSSPARPATDQAVTLVATVTSAANQQSPSGAITISANGHAIPGCMLLPVRPAGQSVTVTCQTWFTSSVALTAAFSPAGGTGVNGSSSGPDLTAVGPAGTSVDLGVPQSVTPGNQASFAATVTVPGAAPGAPAPVGTVGFYNSGKLIAGCSAVRLSGGRAACQQTLTKSGNYPISASFSGSGSLLSSKSGSQLVTVGAPSGFVTAYLAWTFNFTPSYTRVLGLQASQMTAGSSITLLCSGGGCPFKRRDIAVRAHCVTVKKHKRCSAPSAVDLARVLHGRHLRPGATLKIDITHRSWLGKYYRFAFRARTKPQTTVGCLDVSSLQPGSCGA